MKLFHVDTLQNQVTDSSDFWMSLAALDMFDNIAIHIQQICQLYQQRLKKLSFPKDPGNANTEQQISTVCHFSSKLAALRIFRKVIFPSSSILTKWWWQTNNEPISSEGKADNNFNCFFSLRTRDQMRKWPKPLKTIFIIVSTEQSIALRFITDIINSLVSKNIKCSTGCSALTSL